MRVFSRISLTLFGVVILSASAAVASHFEADCPLQLVAQRAPAEASAFYQSPHGVFRSGNQVFALRGQTLSTFTINDLGDMQLAREDFIGTMGGRESGGGTAFSNGFLYVSSDAGLEIFDLRNVRQGGSAPVLMSRTPGLHYRRLAISGSTLAGVFPAVDFPCAVGGPTPNCFNTVDLYNVSNSSAPLRVGTVSSVGSSLGGFNDVAFNYGFLVITGNNGTAIYNISNPNLPAGLSGDATPGTFLVSNGANFLAIGSDSAILTLTVSPGGLLTPMFMHTLAALRLERANSIVFHRQATIDEATSRLITLVDELDPQTLQPARTIAFDVFDYGVAMFEGRDPRQYEQVSYTRTDEVKHNPLAVGPFVYVVGEVSGIQEYGACGQITGRIEFESLLAFSCPTRIGTDPTVTELHGWVTGATRIANVEIFLDGGSLGTATVSGPPRIDVPSTTPVQPWRINVSLAANLGGTSGPGIEHVIRAVGTDITGNRRQFASQRILFPANWQQQTCLQRRRAIR
jgi:hypothetical protein